MSDTSDDEIFYGELGNVQAEDNNWQGFDFEPRREDYPELYQNEWGSEGATPTDTGSENEADWEPENENNRIGNTDWCLCGNCSPMPTRAESICCQEITPVTVKCNEAESKYCFQSNLVSRPSL